MGIVSALIQLAVLFVLLNVVASIHPVLTIIVLVALVLSLFG